MLLINGFDVLSISGMSQNLKSSSVMCKVASTISCCQNDILICPGSGIFKTFALRNYRCRKNNFFDYCCMTECLNVIPVIKHDFLIHLHLLGPSGDVETLTFQARVTTPPWGSSDVYA